MADVFGALTGGIKFKKEIEEKKEEKIHTNQKTSIESRRTKDPAERVNLVRKHHSLRVSGDAVPPPVEAFKKLKKLYGVSDKLLEAMHLQGFQVPTPVQIQALPLLLCKRDILAISPTGSGKTLAFLLPIAADIEKARGAGFSGPYGLILAPTQELVQQTARVMTRLGQCIHLSCSAVTKGSAAGQDFSKLEVVVSVPLALSHLVGKTRVSLKHVRFLVLDETDKLLEVNKNPHSASHVHHVDKVMTACTHPDLCTSIFSATIPETVENLARSFLKDPVRLTVGNRNATASSVLQSLRFAGSEEGKTLLLQELLQSGLKAPVLIFVASRDKAVALKGKLVGYKVDCLFSGQESASRRAGLEDFRSGEKDILIATDILARGIDFVNIQSIINFDCPSSTTDYVHRIGRTGRGTHIGTAITFFTDKDDQLIRPIANLIAETGQEVPGWMLSKSRRLPVPRKRKIPDN